MTKKAKAIRETFRKQFRDLASQFHESQSEQYPQAYRDTEGARIKQEMRRLEAQFQNDMIVWSHRQRVEVARLRAVDPPGDAATETRRLREQMEAGSLAEQFPSPVQARNMLVPEARRYLNAGNMNRAQVQATARGPVRSRSRVRARGVANARPRWHDVGSGKGGRGLPTSPRPPSFMDPELPKTKVAKGR